MAEKTVTISKAVTLPQLQTELQGVSAKVTALSLNAGTALTVFGADDLTPEQIVAAVTAHVPHGTPAPAQLGSRAQTGSGNVLLGTNSPASTGGQPATWLQVTLPDGSTGWVPVWK